MGVKEEHLSFRGFGIFSCLSDLNFPLLLAGLQIVHFQIIISKNVTFYLTF